MTRDMPSKICSQAPGGVVLAVIAVGALGRPDNDHPVAGRDAGGVRSDRHDGACRTVSGDERKRGEPVAADTQGVGDAHRRRVETDTHLACLRLPKGHVDHLEPARLGNDDCLHRNPPESLGGRVVPVLISGGDIALIACHTRSYS
ncbi:hypothetical protein GOOTI_073_00070 [Gordonia otitidis NBRC 100426]|uniref:Uncharacterized protein n=1 Tax=Gordonia otitidis (strain DSM 44809 / CCUG 52243 / JCM 12355 / NBRC 100426 / IFM 10032) TaxID=1108044 RepID=H5TJD3_GORO1|nr:hypothetical protein GOOTI_073_00070 [Gordonia otitidis NBRC 100426]